MAELKGAVGTIPHQGILINTLTLQEAKDSSEIENIVTTHDQLYQRESADDETIKHATKEVLRYRQALWTVYKIVRNSGLLTAVEFTARDATRTISFIQQALLDAKHRIRSRFKFYSQDLINNLFTNPYTKIAFI